VLYYKPNIPLALIEAKDNSHGMGDGMQQGLDYATTLHIPFVFSSKAGFKPAPTRFAIDAEPRGPCLLCTGRVSNPPSRARFSLKLSQF
jgi:hypothetical protein